MRTIGRLHIVSPDAFPRIMEELLSQPRDPVEIERRRQLAEEVDQIRDAMEPLESDVKEIVRENWERGA